MFQQPDVEMVEVRKVDGWHVTPPRVAKIVPRNSCRDEVTAWFSTDWVDDHVIVFLSSDAKAPARPPILSLEERVQEHAARWEKDTAYLSSTPRKILHEDYQAIMAMGPDVIPILLNDLRTTQRSWFWALRHLTGADPVPPAERGQLDKMVAAWIAWGTKEGKI